jgi:hypothetical protein
MRRARPIDRSAIARLEGTGPHRHRFRALFYFDLLAMAQAIGPRSWS